MTWERVKLRWWRWEKREANYSKVTTGFHEFRGIVEDDGVHLRISFGKLDGRREHMGGWAFIIERGILDMIVEI